MRELNPGLPDRKQVSNIREEDLEWHDFHTVSFKEAGQWSIS
jgi:hypothetical protein